jgi:hypothetical protein
VARFGNRRFDQADRGDHAPKDTVAAEQENGQRRALVDIQAGNRVLTGF